MWEDIETYDPYSDTWNPVGRKPVPSPPTVAELIDKFEKQAVAIFESHQKIICNKKDKETFL